MQFDLDWLLRVGLVRVVDKLIEHPEFTGAVSLICHVAFGAGAECDNPKFPLYEHCLFNRSQFSFSDFQAFPNKLVYIRVYV